MTDYGRIIKECFWDANISEDDISGIISSPESGRKSFLFEKIMLNSTKLLKDLQLFPIEDLRMLLENFKVTEFNHDYVFRRKNISEVFFLNKPLRIDELKWPA